jgi:hypothetical protein
VHGCDCRNLVAPRPSDGAMRDDVGAGDVDDVGVELVEVAADTRGNRDRHAVFGPAGDRDRGNVDEVAGGGEGGVLDRRRIDAHLHALPQQIADEPVQRLIGPVPNIIVIARKEGDAEITRLHGRAVGANR